MATVSMNGVTYTTPSEGAENWGTYTTTWITAASQALHRSGGTFTLTSDVNFGASKGLLVAYVAGRSTPAAAGLIRLGNTETINWKNAAGSADLSVNVKSDMLQFNGTNVVVSGSVTTSDISATANISPTQLIALTASRALATNATGHLVVATTTATELGYVNGVTSALQTQMDAKLATATLTTKGDLLSKSTSVGRLPVGTDGYHLQSNSSSTFGIDWSKEKKGTATNDSAAAGYIGEYTEAKTTTDTSWTTTSTYADGTSLSLTAGDWDVTAIFTAIANTVGGMTKILLGISSTSGNSGTGLSYHNGNVIETPTPPTSVTKQTLVIPNFRVSLSETTTYYLKYLGAYTSGVPQYNCILSARRIR